MEASERPQLPLDGGDADGSVRLVGDRIVIEDLTIADEQTARVVRERAETGEEPGRAVRRAIEIGARVLDREDTAVEVDYVRREFEHLQSDHREIVEQQNRAAVEAIEENLQKAIGDGEAPGALGSALESHSGELSEMIAETFGEDREGAVQSQIRRILEERDEQFLQRLSADDERNPLAPMLASLRNWTKERKADQDTRDEKLEAKLDELVAKMAELSGLDQGREALEEAEEAGTRKGRSFEDRVGAAIERVAMSRGDAARQTGDEPGAGGSKKGDVVVEIGAAEGPSLGRMVFEVKDSRLSRPKAWDELNGALEARVASFAVLVVAGEANMPPDREQLHEYEGNKLIVAVDPDEPDDVALDVAYRFARLRVLLSNEADLSVDAGGVRDAAAEARAALDALKAIKSSMTKATNNVDQARAAVEAMVGLVLDRLERIESLVESAE
jgi:hypothetical protein